MTEHKTPSNVTGPLVLAIDMCGAAGTVALSRFHGDATFVVAEAELIGRTFASLLITRIAKILSEGGVQLADLEAIAVVHGPGSFTGVRIGVAAAKAFAEATGKPLIAVSRLAVLCSQARLAELCCGLLDAGRGEFYAGFYREGECLREQVMTHQELTAATTEAVLVTAESAIAAAFPHSKLITVPVPSAAAALPLVAQRFLAGSFDDPATLDGNYLRRTDAELFASPQPRTIVAPAQ